MRKGLVRYDEYKLVTLPTLPESQTILWRRTGDAGRWIQMRECPVKGFKPIPLEYTPGNYMMKITNHYLSLGGEWVKQAQFHIYR